MVVLGFRPKAAAPAAKENVLKQEISQKKLTVKLNKSNDKPNETKINKSPNKSTSKTPAKPKIKRPFNASSNWEKLKSLNTLKVAPESGTINVFDKAPSAAVKPHVSDQEWFGIKNVESLQSLESVGMLRSNVSAITLFPPLLNKEKAASQACKYVALDCEMVGVGPGGFQSILARVSVVNFHGAVLADVYVKPMERVTDFRTAVSGITAKHITPSHEDPSKNHLGQPLLTLREAQELIFPLLEGGRIIVGHSLKSDFSALMAPVNRKLCRDTSHYEPFKALAEGKTPSLKKLAAHILGIQIQENMHDSVEDARIAMLLYRAVKKDWESKQFTKKSEEK